MNFVVQNARVKSLQIRNIKMSTVTKTDCLAAPMHTELPAHKTGAGFAAEMGHSHEGMTRGNPQQSRTEGMGGKGASEAGAIPTPPGGFDWNRG
jgi:hypothetical protein